MALPSEILVAIARACDGKPFEAGAKGDYSRLICSRPFGDNQNIWGPFWGPFEIGTS